VQTQPHILILGLNYPPEKTGVSPYTGALAQGLQARDFLVRVFTTYQHYPSWRFSEVDRKWSRTELVSGVQVVRLRHFLSKKPRGLGRLLSEVSFGVRLLVAKWGKPDIVLLVSPALISTTLALARIRLMRRPVPAVVWVQDLYSLGISETGAGGSLVARIMTWVESRTLRSASHVVVIHPRFKKYVVGTLGVTPERVSIVRNWSHLPATTAIDVPAVRARYGWDEDELVVLHAGNMGAKQGLSNVVEAARLADEQEAPIRFVLLGDGSERRILEQTAASICRIQFIEPIEQNDFQAILVAANVLLVNEKPGVSEMAVPSKLTSYFTAGRPVLAATDRFGVTSEEIKSAGAGIVVDAGDPAQLLAAALSLRDTRRASTFGNNALRFRTEVLGEDAAIKNYAGLLTNLSRGSD